MIEASAPSQPHPGMLCRASRLAFSVQLVTELGWQAVHPTISPHSARCSASSIGHGVTNV